MSSVGKVAFGFVKYMKYVLFLLLLIAMTQQSHAQFGGGNKRYKGSHAQNSRKYYGGKKKGKRNKNIKNKADRKSFNKHNKLKYKTNQNTNRRQTGRNRFGRKKKSFGKSKKLYKQKKFGAKARKRKQGKGRYPKSKSQFKDKLGYYLGAGVLVANNEDLARLDIESEIENSSVNLQTGPLLDLGLYFSPGEIWQVDIGLRYYNITENPVSLNNLGLKGNLRLHPFKSSAKFSPFIGVSLSVYTSILNKSGRDDNYAPSTEYSFGEENDPTFTEVLSIESSVPEQTVAELPIYGTGFNFGYHYRMNNKIAIYMKVEFMNYFTEDLESFKEVIPGFNSNIQDYSLSIGFKYALVKNSKLY